MENYLNRTYRWISTWQVFNIHASLDYLISIWSLDSIGDINIRWAMWWGLMWSVNWWIDVHNSLSQIVQSKPFIRRKQLQKLTDDPVVLFHEHLQADQELACLIFQKYYQNNSMLIRVRYFHFVNEILKNDIKINLCNPNRSLQRDLFYKYEEVDVPIFLSDKDLDEISQLLIRIYWVQKKYYQEKVNSLLSMYPFVNSL